ncbi:hypothetical protein [Xanthomonas campestris]|nr:hypothetical protein [Xanthomonas campestris]MEA9645612.1 hypothetical protein [Xanthomonas campestris WHRI 8523]MEA9622506.1 hypothetical protein [Xanthomonas campestris]MEA9637440.1 hypothetical protein [Xanthomonas campestris]MEA9642661.1 hypothetical protein [Xanthomonas campestris]MEA9669958.1 hypothetical protein [Xanthomonas campestris]
MIAVDQPHVHGDAGAVMALRVIAEPADALQVYALRRCTRRSAAITG